MRFLRFILILGFDILKECFRCGRFLFNICLEITGEIYPGSLTVPFLFCGSISITPVNKSNQIIISVFLGLDDKNDIKS